MLKSSRFLPACLALFLLLYACDDEPGVTDVISPPPSLNSLSVEPDSIGFDRQDGEKDTTLTLDMEATLSNLAETDSLPRYIILDLESEETLTEGTMSAVESEPGLFEASVPVTISTNAITTWKLTAFIFNEDGQGNTIEMNIPVDGFSSSPPEILFVNNPDTVVRPQNGTEITRFTAKVTDPDGQNTIQNVFLELINPDGASTGVFDMLDDGGEESGDEVAADSVFTVTFGIDNTSRAGNFDLLYYARDQLGLVSDTVESKIVIE